MDLPKRKYARILVLRIPCPSLPMFESSVKSEESKNEEKVEAAKPGDSLEVLIPYLVQNQG